MHDPLRTGNSHGNQRSIISPADQYTAMKQQPRYLALKYRKKFGTFGKQVN